MSQKGHLPPWLTRYAEFGIAPIPAIPGVDSARKITVFGSPNAELKEMLARREPMYETYIDGFMR